ncbi:MAG TPA: taurine ABC transporter substrate-binding protein [Alphaproteobacteria bacterium]|nr:taurine ABC transporter substrate-binding protein [Alphaproteobacteria bacterium]
MGKALNKLLAAALFAGLAVVGAAPQAAEKEATVGYQLIYNPWANAIVEGAFEKATGYKINWVQFDSGAKVINAMASGDVHLALAGSSPIAAGVSRGLDIEMVWVVEDIASAEALVVRNGSGIIAPQDLKGKKIACPFVSTTHFHLLFALEQFGIDPSEVNILNMQPPEIAAAWERGDIDGAFVWDPALGQIKKTGKVLITSGQLSTWGKATFDGLIANKTWAAENPDFMVAFIKTLAAADESYRSNPQAWTADSQMAKNIVKLVGGNPEDVPGVLALYGFPSLEEQASSAWLGGGKEGGVARALMFTSEFLLKEKKIDATLEDYSVTVNPKWVEMALGQ